MKNLTHTICSIALAMGAITASAATDATSQYEYSAAPAPGVISEFPNIINITIDGFYTIFPRPGMNPAAHITYPDGSVLDCEVYNAEYSNTVSINVVETLTTPGVYKVTLDCDALCNEELEILSGKIEFEYLLGTRTVNITPTPGPVKEISDVTFVVRNATSVEITDASSITFTDNRNDAIPFTHTSTGNAFTINATAPVKENGVYTICINPGAITIDGEKYAFPIEAAYEISATSVNAIISEGSHADIYNIDGSLRISNASAEDLRTIDGGIYIVNGKKIILNN